ncbi:MAG TPA: LytTR family DNA-binding domain-containing protein, partial [Chitinophagaceae bacterium]|nr:LytTR family DNA-binding domain-containing protein [Chitinophagaceae bacterium]
MKIRCIAIDDESPALLLMKEYISRIPFLQLQYTFEDAIKGQALLQQEGTDLLFVDINMPDISGLELVRSLSQPPMVIFTTAYKNFALDGFELDAVDYLVKPIAFERFEKAVKKAQEFYTYRQRTHQSEIPEALFVYAEYRLVKINLADIEYIESLEDYIRIHTTTGKPLMTLMTLKKVLEKLPADQFRRIHRSYIVAFTKVKSIQGRKLRMQSGKELPVSDSYLSF